MMRMHRNKIVVIGAGNTGEAIAYTLMVRVQANEIVLVDSNDEFARDSVLDIGPGTGLFKEVNIRKGDYDDCADAEIIIIAAGFSEKSGLSQIELAKCNISIAKSVAKNIMKYAVNPLILVVSSPVDLTTMAVWKESGLPTERVIGCGTSLETTRFRYLLSKKLKVNIEDVHAYVVGEHGDGQIPVFSSANVGGFPLKDFAGQMGVELDEAEIAADTKNGGNESGKQNSSSYYSTAMVISNIVESIVKDGCAIMPVAHVLNEQFGEWAGVAVSLPCRIGLNGIDQTFMIPMNELEKSLLEASVSSLRQYALQTGA